LPGGESGEFEGGPKPGGELYAEEMEEGVEMGTEKSVPAVADAGLTERGVDAMVEVVCTEKGLDQADWVEMAEEGDTALAVDGDFDIGGDVIGVFPVNSSSKCQSG
jgi:hypothetical protein